ncbi:RtcB family protein [Pontibacter sp. BT310]|uniref:3'-phosphate/5'-hydroxy nucleic acid ligase n=1 Tax=Pontibacter populi TaxID=890055 RepID=A0ABS6XAE7_9BACT|nr:MULTISPECIES: RtcB family protein [Pontibacter]MBJ6118098.1 RtcB family protein [Pontibacter sp. BT310]MBR0570525.1 RtcB family protein [Microvirga sp. STS03]MBW3364951.1 RtcB family protein [Pontibacter populi]
MNTFTLTGKDLLEIGYKPGKALGTALSIMETAYPDLSKEEQLTKLATILASPADYQQDELWAPVAEALVPPKQEELISLLPEAKEYVIYGAEGIEVGAINQMDTAMRLPVSVGGALMPDAHQGYGLPIGGVLATKGAVIPYAVGVDIGCRMSMSLYAIDSGILTTQSDQLKRILLDNTRFGTATFKNPKDHAIMERPEFAAIPIVRSLKDRAYSQLGSSGGGNHFVEFGVVELHNAENEFGLPAGQYLSALSHSGSRGLGANIAGHYTKLAMQNCRLPQEARHLAWLDLKTAEGQEYWLAMNLAGDYASACHHQIHERLAIALGEQPLAVVENHHNFAWKEKDAPGNEVIVHRKGATPAGQGVLGIIPGSMATPGFIVRGKGEANSLNSASHGAGRVMSRTKAKQTLSLPQVQQFLQEAGVEVIGSGLDEAPMVYKDIRQVMNSQQDLVDVVGTFTPKIVRMCGDEKYMKY